MASGVYMKFLYPKKKIIICVPREINRQLAISKIGESQDDLLQPGKDGIFVCTFNQFIKFEASVIKDSILLLDEFHEFMNFKNAMLQLSCVAKVHAVTATIVEKAGYDRLRKMFMNSNLKFDIHDCSNNKV